jgi:hypothetical protein
MANPIQTNFVSIFTVQATASKPRDSIRVARFVLVHDTKTGKNVPNEHKRYQNAHKIFQMAIKYKHFTIYVPPNFAQIGIFGLKINHLATPVSMSSNCCAKKWFNL